MGNFYYKKMQDLLKKGADQEQLVNKSNELIIYGEELYLNYWITSLELDYPIYLDALSDITSLESESSDAELKNIIENLTELYTQIENYANLNQEEINNRIQTLKSHRDMVEKRVKALTSYGDLWRIVEYVQRRRPSNIIEMESDEDFVGRVIQFIFEDNDSVVINEKIKSIYGQLPVRMTKNRFYNYCDEALYQIKGVSKQSMENYVKTLKDVYYPEGVDEFGKYFEHIYEPLLKFKEADASLEELKELESSIENTMDVLLALARITNNWIGFLSVLQDGSVSQNASRLSHFAKLIKSFENNNEDKMNEETMELYREIEGIIEGLSPEVSKIEGLIDTLLLSYQDMLDSNDLLQRAKNLQMMRALTSSSYFGDLDENIEVSQQEEMVDVLFLSQMQKQLTSYFDEVIKKEERKKQRARMATVFSNINVIHKKPQEVYQFILDAISSVDVSEKAVAKDIIQSIMQDWK